MLSETNGWTRLPFDIRNVSTGPALVGRDLEPDLADYLATQLFSADKSRDIHTERGKAAEKS